ncbi:MAG TPA: glycosyltransferase family A protein [Ferruginibacter sp.]|nr:glycosyltransferase family A protein [Ferruginibacter sp.]
MLPRVSIITPVFNRERVIAETIQSVINQTYKFWELILVDDGSTDETLNIVRGFVENDARITLVIRDRLPKGAPVCRNIGYEQAKGNYIIFLDSDDIIAPNALSTRVGAMEEQKVDFIWCSSAFFTNHPSDAKYIWNRADERTDLDRFLLHDPVWQTTGPTWKKSFLDKYHLRFNEQALSSQDWEFHVRALLKHPVYQYGSSISLPIHTVDNFIRRNIDVKTISSTHAGNEKAVNRLQLITELLSLEEVKGFKPFEEKLLFTLLLECIRLLNARQKIPTEVHQAIRKYAPEKNPKLASITSFLYRGIYWQKMGNRFFSIYRRLYYKKMVNEHIFGRSQYRSELTNDERNYIVEMFEQNAD